METSPSINEKIIKLFNKTFPTTKSTVVEDINKDITRPDIKRPEICDELISTAEIVFITPETDKNAKRASLIELTRKKNKIMENYEREVNEWITKFENKHNRKPLESEMIDNLQDKMNPDILNKIVKKILAGFENDDEQLDALNNV
jgi:DNA-binding MarR family transcriptional regulator